MSLIKQWTKEAHEAEKSTTRVQIFEVLETYVVIPVKTIFTATFFCAFLFQFILSFSGCIFRKQAMRKSKRRIIQKPFCRYTIFSLFSLCRIRKDRVIVGSVRRTAKKGTGMRHYESEQRSSDQMLTPKHARSSSTMCAVLTKIHCMPAADAITKVLLDQSSPFKTNLLRTEFIYAILDEQFCAD